jgi:hypothetical protein
MIAPKVTDSQAELWRRLASDAFPDLAESELDTFRLRCVAAWAFDGDDPTTRKMAKLYEEFRIFKGLIQ